MRKALIIFVLIISVIGVAAATEAVLNMTEDAVVSELTAEDAERKALINEALEDGMYDPGDKYATMLLALDATVENPIDYNTIVYNFEYLKTFYDMTDEQMNYLYELIIKGYSPEDVLEICYFWTDTNEDITIIDEIYALKDRYVSKTWIENAFNFVTGDKCGVLTTEDVEEYLGRGVSLSDITTANKLCRKGVLTIQEILEHRIEGKSFDEISAMINGEPTMTASVMSLGTETQTDEEAEYILEKEIRDELKERGVYKNVTREQMDEYHREQEGEIDE